jgi:hypothetical protein
MSRGFVTADAKQDDANKPPERVLVRLDPNPVLPESQELVNDESDEALDLVGILFLWAGKDRCEDQISKAVSVRSQ